MKALHSAATLPLRFLLGPLLAAGGAWSLYNHLFLAAGGPALLAALGTLIPLLFGAWLSLRPGLCWFDRQTLRYWRFGRRELPFGNLLSVDAAFLPLRNQPLRITLRPLQGEALAITVLPPGPGSSGIRHPIVDEFLKYAAEAGARIDARLLRSDQR